MGKLLKYEFIKSRVPLILFTTVLVIAELLFIIGLNSERDGFIGASFIIFFIMTPICTLGGLILGAGAYTKELSNKIGFMIYMTPNSSYKIVGCKFIFTAIVEIFFSAILGLAAYVDATILLKDFGIDEEKVNILFDIAESFGLSIPELLVKAGAAFLTVILSMIMVVAIYYIAYTLTATFMQANKGRGWVAALVFILGDILVIKIRSLLPEIAYSSAVNGLDVVSLLPTILYSLLIIAISYFACSYMLDKKVSL